MPYVGDKTWADIERDIQNHARQIIQAIQAGVELQAEMTVFAAGRNATQIAADLAAAGESQVTVTYIQDANSALQAMAALRDLGENVAVAQGDYFDDLRKFT